MDFESAATAGIGIPITVSKPIPTIICSNFMCLPPSCIKIIGLPWRHPIHDQALSI
jgi:hypothetical protein